MANTDYTAQLLAGAAALGVDLDAAAASVMFEYLALLNKWNRAYNLTSLETLDEEVPGHLLDSLSAVPWLEGERVVDVGSGAGLPGIPLALAQPHRHFTLLEPRAKRVRFLEHVRRELGLENVAIAHARSEDYRPDTGFATVIARALAALPKLLGLTGHLLAPGGIVLAMKGRYPQAELDALDQVWRVRDIHAVEVPGLNAARHLIVVERDD